MKGFFLLWSVLLIGPRLALAQQANNSQQKQQDNTQNMPGMDMSQMPGMQMGPNGAMNMQPQNFIQEILAHDTSGTSAEPNSTPTPMLM